ncbi:gliding motility lipoprotein GldD [Flavobacteriaceae bacterium XHP0103]|uniref:gliding motility lipoprotein GldD n=1 Tax=Marixanthotalea marina TaxID=2844359 RepID=UPI002989EB49|nr:gliding motility lipoprotein GldD [Marixanthotalea marina]MBU3822154.1 gliding motility lipoprotein GldD [Marixanthotalea marina]
MIKNSCLMLLVVLCISCGGDVVPKPNAYLRLEYPKAKYNKTQIEVLPFTVEINELAKNVTSKKMNSTTESYGVNIEYPALKGTIFLTYKAIEDNPENLTNFLRDAQNLTQKHTLKADEINEQQYANKERNVFGMFYEVGGNAASQSQFYVTDSIQHFLTGSLYFYAKPNYDSILPAAKYLENDIRHIMETINWE